VISGLRFSRRKAPDMMAGPRRGLPGPKEDKMTKFAPKAIAVGAGLLSVASLVAAPALAQSGIEQDMSAAPDKCEVMTALTGERPAECVEASVPVKTRGLSISGDGTTTSAPPPRMGDIAPSTNAGAAPAQGPRAASFSSIRFAVNSDALTPEAAATLDTVADALRDPRMARATLLVEGHTDASGSDEYNMALSERRANAVVDYLTARGVTPAMLTPRGMGETRLADPDNPRSGANRRVVLVNLGG